MNFYKKSKKEFKRYIRENPYTTKEEWDNYAHRNCLASAFTLECHEIIDETLKLLIMRSKDRFEFLKEIFIIIPPKSLKKIEKLCKLRNGDTKENEN